MVIKPRFTTDYKDLSVLIKTIRIGIINNQFKGYNGLGPATNKFERGNWTIETLNNIKKIHVEYKNIDILNHGLDFKYLIDIPIETLYNLFENLINIGD